MSKCRASEPANRVGVIRGTAHQEVNVIERIQELSAEFKVYPLRYPETLDYALVVTRKAGPVVDLVIGSSLPGIGFRAR